MPFLVPIAVAAGAGALGATIAGLGTAAIINAAIVGGFGAALSVPSSLPSKPKGALLGSTTLSRPAP